MVSLTVAVSISVSIPIAVVPVVPAVMFALVMGYDHQEICLATVAGFIGGCDSDSVDAALLVLARTFGPQLGRERTGNLKVR